MIPPQIVGARNVKYRRDGGDRRKRHYDYYRVKLATWDSASLKCIGHMCYIQLDPLKVQTVGCIIYRRNLPD